MVPVFCEAHLYFWRKDRLCFPRHAAQHRLWHFDVVEHLFPRRVFRNVCCLVLHPSKKGVNNLEGHICIRKKRTFFWHSLASACLRNKIKFLEDGAPSISRDQFSSSKPSLTKSSSFKKLMACRYESQKEASRCLRSASSPDPSSRQRPSSPSSDWPPPGLRGERRRELRSSSPWRWHICGISHTRSETVGTRSLNRNVGRNKQKKNLTLHFPAYLLQRARRFLPGHSWCCWAGWHRSVPIPPNCCWSPCPDRYIPITSPTAKCTVAMCAVATGTATPTGSP